MCLAADGNGGNRDSPLVPERHDLKCAVAEIPCGNEPGDLRPAAVAQGTALLEHGGARGQNGIASLDKGPQVFEVCLAGEAPSQSVAVGFAAF